MRGLVQTACVGTPSRWFAAGQPPQVRPKGRGVGGAHWVVGGEN